MSKPEPKVYCFWGYDLFPHICCGAGSFNEAGDFYANGYGFTISRKNIVTVRTIREGEKIEDAINLIKEEYRSAIKDVENKFAARVHSLLPELKAVRDFKENHETDNRRD